MGKSGSGLGERNLAYSNSYLCVQVEKLRKELEELKKQANVHVVDKAIIGLQTLIGRPRALFDAYAALAALEEVVHLAQQHQDERVARYSVILRQCRPLVSNAVLQSVLIKLVASKDEAEVSKAIDKALKGELSPTEGSSAGRTRSAPYSYRRGAGRGKSPAKNLRCWACGQEGHFARACRQRR